MRSEGYGQLRIFLDSYIADDDRALKTGAGKLFDQGGFRKTFHSPSHHPPLSMEGRVKPSSTTALNDHIGYGLVNQLGGILSQELKDIQKSGVLRLPAAGITLEHAENFDFGTLANRFFRKDSLHGKLGTTSSR